MSQSLQTKAFSFCGLCKNEPKNTIKLNCNHKLCLECGKVLQQTEMDQLIQAKFKIICPQCNKMTRSFNIHNLIVDESVCVKLIGKAPSHTNSPQKLRNSSQKNIERKSIQQYFSPTLKNAKRVDTNVGSARPASRQGSFHIKTQNDAPNESHNIQQVNHSFHQPIVHPNNFQYSTPQKLMNTIDSLMENSNPNKTTQPSSILKNTKNEIFNSGQNSLLNSLNSTSMYQNYLQGINQSQQKNQRLGDTKPVKAYNMMMSDDSKKEQCRNLAQQYIQRQPQQQQKNNLAMEAAQSIYSQNFSGAKVVEPEAQCKYLSGNNFSSVVAVEVDPTTGAPFQDSASNIQQIQGSLPTQNENLLTFQDNSSSQNQSPFLYPDSYRCGQDAELLKLNQKTQGSQDQIVERSYEQDQLLNSIGDQDEQAKRRYQYYLNKRNEILKENYTYITHQNHFSGLIALQAEQQKGQAIKCNIHNDFMTLFDESDSSFCCPSCVYENAASYQKKTILPLKMCSQFINKDINNYKEGLRGKLQYIDNNITCSQLNQKLLQDNFTSLNKRITQTFQNMYQHLQLKETEIKNEVKRQYEEELRHYQKILCEMQPLQDSLKFTIKHFQPNSQLDEFNNNLYYHTILKKWQAYLNSYKRDVPVYTAEDMNIVEFPKISQISKLIDNIAVIKNIQENSCKDIIKKLEEASQIKKLNHITIPDNVVIKQTATHYLKTTTRSKGRNDFKLNESIENIHQQSISGVSGIEIHPFRDTIFRSSSKEKTNGILNTSSSNIHYSSVQKDNKANSCKKPERTSSSSVLAVQGLIKSESNKEMKQSLHKSSSFQVQNACNSNKNITPHQNINMFQQGSNRSTNQSLENSQRIQGKQPLSDQQTRNLFKYIIQQK